MPSVCKAEYLKTFDQKIHGPLYKQKWVNDEIKQFETEMYKLKQFYCDKCHELWPTTNGRCETCKFYPNKFSEVCYFKFFDGMS